MGTQQLFMIILTVVVVGASVAVGMQMFERQSINLERNAVVMEVLKIAAEAQAYWIAPELMNGANYNVSNIDVDNIAKYINRKAGTNGIYANQIHNAVGTFTITRGGNTIDDAILYITGMARPNAERPIIVRGTVDLKEGYEGIFIEPFFNVLEP